MSIDFKKLLPTNIRENKLATFSEAFGRVLTENIKPELVDVIRDQSIFDLMTIVDIKNIAYSLGFTITEGLGYTATLDYFKKQVRFIVPRIKTKTTRISYQYEFSIFDLSGEVYPLLISVGSQLEPFLDWVSYDDSQEELSYLLDNDPIKYLDADKDNLLYLDYTTLDVGNLFDSGNTLDDSIFVYDFPQNDNFDKWYLDNFNNVSSMTRHILVRYSFLAIENSTDFMSLDSSVAFYKDVQQLKRNIEITHFEPSLNLIATQDNQQTTTSYTTKDRLTTASQESILIGANFTDLPITTIVLGNGKHTTIDNTITNVQNIVQSYTLNDLIIGSLSNVLFEFEKVKLERTKIFDYSEIALLDINGDVIFYSTFPKVILDPNMLSSFHFKIDIVI